MTVKELKEKLNNFPDDFIVCYFNSTPFKGDPEYNSFVEFTDWGDDFSLEEIEKLYQFKDVKYIDTDINFVKGNCVALIST
jgi:hypothetical protein